MITNIIGRLARLRKSNTIERENENIFSVYCFLENSIPKTFIPHEIIIGGN